MQQKVWVFPLKNRIKNTAPLREQIEAFLSTWDAHGEKVSAKLDIQHGQVITIYLDQGSIVPTGCSKDKLDKSIRQICTSLGHELVEESNTVLLKDGEILILNRPQLKTYLTSNSSYDNLSLLDFSILGREDLNHRELFRPIEETWALNFIN